VAVASTAPSGTLEHELGHVGQRQEQGFSLDEGNRQAHEQDADEIAGKLLASQPVERFGQTVSAKKRLLPSQMLEARMTQRMQQAKCTKCESDEQQALSKPMAEALGDRDKTQAKVTVIEQAVSQNEMSIPSNTAIAESSPKLQAAALAAAPAVVFGPVGLAVAVGIRGVTIVIWLNNGGWQQIGEIADVIGKGIEGTLQELKEILNRAGKAASNQLEQVESFITKTVYQFSKRRSVIECKCKARFTKDQNPPDHCPDFVWGRGESNGEAQKDAKLTAPEECRMFYGHCDCRPVTK